MSRKVGDINAKIAYITNRKTGPILKAKRPFVHQTQVKKQAEKKQESPCLVQLHELIECVNSNDRNISCTAQFEALVACNQAHKAAVLEKKQQMLKGEKIDGSFHTRILQDILLRYPNKFDKKAYAIQKNQMNTLPSTKHKVIPFIDLGRPYNKR